MMARKILLNYSVLLFLGVFFRTGCVNHLTYPKNSENPGVPLINKPWHHISSEGENHPTCPKKSGKPGVFHKPYIHKLDGPRTTKNPFNIHIPWIFKGNNHPAYKKSRQPGVFHKPYIHKGENYSTCPTKSGKPRVFHKPYIHKGVNHPTCPKKSAKPGVFHKAYIHKMDSHKTMKNLFDIHIPWIFKGDNHPKSKKLGQPRVFHKPFIYRFVGSKTTKRPQNLFPLHMPWIFKSYLENLNIAHSLRANRKLKHHLTWTTESYSQHRGKKQIIGKNDTHNSSFLKELINFFHQAVGDDTESEEGAVPWGNPIKTTTKPYLKNGVIYPRHFRIVTETPDDKGTRSDIKKWQKKSKEFEKLWNRYPSFAEWLEHEIILIYHNAIHGRLKGKAKATGRKDNMEGIGQIWAFSKTKTTPRKDNKKGIGQIWAFNKTFLERLGKRLLRSFEKLIEPSTTTDGSLSMSDILMDATTLTWIRGTEWISNGVQLSTFFEFSMGTEVYYDEPVTPSTSEDEEFISGLSSCRLSPSGLDYQGLVFYTQSHNFCLNWNHPFLIPKMEMFHDKDFPDASIKDAESRCRNPDSSPSPWCFRRRDMIRENCMIPICQPCQYTGPGLEYSGYLNKSVYGECSRWRPNIRSKFTPKVDLRYQTSLCRNPTYDPAGPWCYTQLPLRNGTKVYQKAYCDIPMCHVYGMIKRFKDKKLRFRAGTDVFFTSGQDKGYHTHYTLIGGKEDHINVSLRLWDPEQLFKGILRIALTSIAVPATGAQLTQWQAGLEVIISNNKTGIASYPDQESAYVRTAGILSGGEWVNITIGWHDQGQMFIRRSEDEEGSYLYQQMTNTSKDTIIGLYKYKYQYFSIIGTPCFIKLLSPVLDCEEHITTENVYSRFYHTLQEEYGRKVDFAVKSPQTCFMLLKLSPFSTVAPEILMSISSKKNSTIKLRTLDEDSKDQVTLSEEVLITTNISGLIIGQKWTFFSLIVKEDRLTVLVKLKGVLHYIFDHSNVHFKNIRYYAVSSTVKAHWNLGCEPAGSAIPLLSVYENPPKECSTDSYDKNYIGEKSVSQTGRTCLPWISEFSKSTLDLFVDYQSYEAVNFCRNIGYTELSAFCYVYNTLADMETKKEYCIIPKCRYESCRLSGISIGQPQNITLTISARQCKRWNETLPKFIKMFKKVVGDEDTKPNKLMDITRAKDYCRNPNRDIGGPWCCTTDPYVPYEPCYMPDCNRTLHSTILLANDNLHLTYVKPMWRVTGFKFWLKRWDGGNETGLNLNIMTENHRYIQIMIGAANGTKIAVFYGSEEDEPLLVAQKAPYEHFLLEPDAWTGYHLTLKENMVTFGYIEDPFPFINLNYSTFLHLNDSSIDDDDENFDVVDDEQDPDKLNFHYDVNPNLDNIKKKLYDMSQFTPDTIDFKPVYLSFEKINEGVLAISFDHQDPLMEISISDDVEYEHSSDDFYEALRSEKKVGSYYPVDFWKPYGYFPVENITLSFRGTGSAAVKFYTVVSMGPEVRVTVGGNRFLSEMSINEKLVGLAHKNTTQSIFTKGNWSTLAFILSSELDVNVYLDGEQFTRWTSPRPFLPYYFSVETIGTLMWIANSQPPGVFGKICWEEYSNATNLRSNYLPDIYTETLGKIQNEMESVQIWISIDETTDVEDIDSEPVMGEWSEWSDWNCSVTCGGGRGARLRECLWPHDSLFNLPCVGPTIVHGFCNTFKCGDLPTGITDVINYRLKHYYFSENFTGLRPMRIKCHNDILGQIRQYVPTAYVYWMKNGDTITNRTEIQYINTELFAWDKYLAYKGDSGVYACVVETPFSKRPVMITSVIVITPFDITHHRFTGYTFTFRCNNLYLANVYTDLEQTWLHNGSIYFRHAETFISASNVFRRELGLNDSGIWQCFVRHRIFNMTWHTNWLKLKVIYRSDFAKYLMEDNLYTRNFFRHFPNPNSVVPTFWTIIAILIGFSFGFAVLLGHCYRVLIRERLLEQQSKKLTRNLLRRWSKSQDKDSDASQSDSDVSSGTPPKGRNRVTTISEDHHPSSDDSYSPTKEPVTALYFSVERSSKDKNFDEKKFLSIQRSSLDKVKGFQKDKNESIWHCSYDSKLSYDEKENSDFDGLQTTAPVRSILKINTKRQDTSTEKCKKRVTFAPVVESLMMTGSELKDEEDNNSLCLKSMMLAYNEQTATESPSLYSKLDLDRVWEW